MKIVNAKGVSLELADMTGKTAAEITAAAKELSEQAKAAGANLVPSMATKFLRGEIKDSQMGWTIEGKPAEEDNSQVDASAGDAEQNTGDTATDPGLSMLASLVGMIDPALAAAEANLTAAVAASKKTVKAASGQSGQRMKRVERVTGLMAEHPDLKPLFDMFTAHGMDVPQKLRNIRPSGNTIWFDAPLSKGDELMIVKEASGYKLNHKNVSGGKVNMVASYNVPTMEAIFTHAETMKWLGLEMK